METTDLSGLKWSHSDAYLIVYDYSISFNIFVYAPTDALVFKEKDATCLGVKRMELAPKNDYLAIVTFDEKVKIYNMISWKLVITLEGKTSDLTVAPQLI